MTTSRLFPFVLGRPPQERGKGLHVSDIYNDLYKTLQPERYRGHPDLDETNLPGLVVMGMAWEDWLLAFLLSQGWAVERPGEFRTPEDIAFTPDLLIQRNGETILGEVKLTRRKMVEDLTCEPKFDKWLTQAKAYCYHLSLTRCLFWVMFVDGDYKTQRNFQLRVYDLMFDPRELDDNWAMLLRHAHQRKLLP